MRASVDSNARENHKGLLAVSQGTLATEGFACCETIKGVVHWHGRSEKSCLKTKLKEIVTREQHLIFARLPFSRINLSEVVLRDNHGTLHITKRMRAGVACSLPASQKQVTGR